MSVFPNIEIAGNAHERGVSHGSQLRDQITQALAFYREIFRLPDDVVLERARHFEGVIRDFNPDYLTEINGIAEGAGVDPLWIVALNARTEILSLTKTAGLSECTSMCFSGAPILGQTWDWGEALEPLCVMMRLTREDGHVIHMMTEPGIIGKIGMNSTGLGVCLNILTLGQPLDGVPIHVMLRGILDSASAADADAVIGTAPLGKSSNIIVADGSGAGFIREFAGAETLTPADYDGSLVHTNHYLGRVINAPDDPLYENSRTRMATAVARVTATEDQTVESMIDILSDRSAGEFPIYRPYKPDDTVKIVGTVATIVMGLEEREMHVRKGNEANSPFTRFAVG